MSSIIVNISDNNLIDVIKKYIGYWNEYKNHGCMQSYEIFHYKYNRYRL